MKLSEVFGFDMDEIKIWTVVPLQRHPQADEIERASLEWLIGHGVCTPDSPVARSRIGGTLADCMPFTDAKAMYAYACYAYWSFVWDDHLDQLAADPTALARHISEAVRVATEPFQAPVPDDDKWLLPLRDVCRLFAESLDPAGYERVRAGHAVWFAGQLWKESMVRSTEPPSLGEVLRMRLTKAGFWSVYAITTSGGGYHLSAEEHADPLVQAFGQAVFMTAAILNEITSLPKELGTGSEAANLVSALAREHNLDRPASVMKTWELYERTGCLALALQRKLLNDSRPHIATFARQMPQWIPSTLQFQTRAHRYLELPAGRGTLEIPPIILTDAPILWAPEDLTPPPYPDIAWWWEQCQMA